MIALGHVKRFCKNYQQIENYDEAITNDEMYACHHVLEWKYSREELIAMNRYYDVSPDELIFIPNSLHNSAVSIHKGKIKSLENLKDGRFTRIGRAPWNKGKQLSDETKQKLSMSHKGLPSARKGKKYGHVNSGPKKGSHWRLENGKRIYYMEVNNA